MSTCISNHGEFSSHDLDGLHTCNLCGVLDEDAMRAELERLRSEAAKWEKAYGDALTEIERLTADLNVRTGQLNGSREHVEEQPSQNVRYAAEIRKLLDECDQERAESRKRIARLEHDLDEARTAVGDWETECDRLKAELADLRALFDVQQTRMEEVTERWRAESPGDRAGVLPDLGALLAWLMAQADNRATELAEAREELELQRDDIAKAREVMDSDAYRLATGETCAPGQPAGCGDYHNAGKCHRPSQGLHAARRQVLTALDAWRESVRQAGTVYRLEGAAGELIAAWDALAVLEGTDTAAATETNSQLPQQAAETETIRQLTEERDTLRAQLAEVPLGNVHRSDGINRRDWTRVQWLDEARVIYQLKDLFYGHVVALWQELGQLQQKLRQANETVDIGLAERGNLRGELKNTKYLLAKAVKDRDLFRGHSVILNSVGWKVSEALGQIRPGDNVHIADSEANADLLIARYRESLRGVTNPQPPAGRFGTSPNLQAISHGLAGSTSQPEALDWERETAEKLWREDQLERIASVLTHTIGGVPNGDLAEGVRRLGILLERARRIADAAKAVVAAEDNLGGSTGAMGRLRTAVEDLDLSQVKRQHEVNRAVLEAADTFRNIVDNPKWNGYFDAWQALISAVDARRALLGGVGQAVEHQAAQAEPVSWDEIMRTWNTTVHPGPNGGQIIKPQACGCFEESIGWGYARVWHCTDHGGTAPARSAAGGDGQQAAGEQP